MIDVDLAYPFSLGLVAAFNPCGFAMLPTYLAYFVGLDEGERTPVSRVLRGLTVGLTLTAGFMLVFGAIGLLIRNVLTSGVVEERLPWFTIVIGVVLIPLGIAMLLGYEPTLRLPRLQKGGQTRELPSVFLFGVSYAVVSFGCTAPLFISLLATSFTDEGGLVEGMATFFAYAAGMGLVVVFLTMALALARNSVARNMRRVLPYVSRISGGLLILGGLYVISYGWWEIQVQRDASEATQNRAQTALEELRVFVSTWVDDVGAGRLGIALVLAISAMVLLAARQQLAPTRRIQLTAVWVGVYLVLEVVAYRGELIVLPLLRFVGGLPERVANWVQEPLRWAVPLEVLLVAGGVALAAVTIRRRRPTTVPAAR